MPSSAFAMVKDLLAANGGRLRNASSASLSASFEDAARAVNAARHLQRLVRGYSRASATGSLHASILLMHVSDTNAAANDAFSSYAQSGQVMCVGSLCGSVRSIPELQFTDPPIAPSASPAFPGSVLQLLPPMHMEGCVNETHEPNMRGESGQPVPFAAEPSQPPSASLAELQPIAVSSSANPKVPVEAVNPRWVIAGVAAVVVMGTVLIFSPWLKSSSHPHAVSSSEIESLIVHADKDSSDGAYDRAILEYRTVLNSDPSNTRAKAGLAKAQSSKSHP